MDSWENLVLQWVNCLWENQGEKIANLEQLEDGVVYYKLVDKIKPWNTMDYNGSEKEMLLQFLRDEYPKCSLNNQNERLRSLSVASLVLSRLSLEPLFHKSLCTNLSADMQIKIKLVLESIYPLGKKVTEEDFFKIFSLQKKPDFESPALKPRFLLEEFLKSPIARTVHSTSKIHDQSRQLRKLRADIETLSYEKSELVEDIKAQEKQIKELQSKLHDTLVELKSLRQLSHKVDEEDSSDKASDTTSVELTYQKEVKSLESYVSELQTENVQLQDEKSLLTNEIKAYKEKFSAMKEKNKHNEEAIESMLLQLEKKEEELAELKLRHEELCNHLKEKSKLFLNNVSYEADDKTINELSFNKSFNRSEALSSVIEIQLQDTKKELITMQNNFRCINSILTALIEEYDKLKRKTEYLVNQNKESESEDSLSVSDDLKLSIKSAFNKDPKRILFFDLLHSPVTPIRKLRDFTLLSSKPKHINELSNHNEKLKMLLKHEGHRRIVYADRFTCTFHNVFWQKYWDSYLFVLLKVVLQEITKLKLSAGKKDDLDLSSISVTKYNGFTSNEIYRELLNFVKNNCDVEIKRPKPKQYSSVSVQTDVKSYSSTSAQTDVKTYSSACMQTDSKEYSSKDVQTDVKSYFTASSQTDVKTYFSTSIQTDVKEYASIPIQTDDKPSASVSVQTEEDGQDELKSLQTSWVQLSESMQNDPKILKTITLLEENWNSTLKSLKDVTNNYESQLQPELRELLVEKDEIEGRIKSLHTQNLRLLSAHLVSSVQLVTTLAKDSSFRATSSAEDSDLNATPQSLAGRFSDVLSDLDSPRGSDLISFQKDISDKIVDAKRRIDNMDSLIKSYEGKLSSAPASVKVEVEEDEVPTKLPPSEDASQQPQFQKYAQELHEKYESKLERMKEKMKAAFNSQVLMMRKEQEMTNKNKLDALQAKFEYQCHNHAEELKKYKKHIGELTTQLWDVGEKLIIEKQRKEESHRRLKRAENAENQHSAAEPEFALPAAAAAAAKPSVVSQLADITFSSRNGNGNIQHVRGFQIMGNAFSNEDEEGEVFDTTYLRDMQRQPRESVSSADLDRLSILQMRNSKCMPHLKSSYPAEVQYLPATLTEDDIKSGNPEEFLNDSLSQSLLTGEKVKRKVRSRNNSETPNRRSRRFSNIFRKPKAAADK